MRIAVLILGILGALGSGTLGLLWMMNRGAVSFAMEVIRSDPRARDAIERDSEAAWELQQYEKRGRAIPFLLGAVLLGGAGAALAMMGNGVGAGALLLAAAAGPAIINPLGLMFTFPLLIGGILAFFVRPPAPAEPPPRRRPPVLAEA